MGRVYIEVDAFFVIGIMASTKASNTALKWCWARTVIFIVHGRLDS